MKKRIFLMAAACVLALSACGGGAAETKSAESTQAGDSGAASEGTWEPKSTVSIIVPAGAGGNTDLSARVFAQYAKKLSGTDFVVVNANGAAGSVAAN